MSSHATVLLRGDTVVSLPDAISAYQTALDLPTAKGDDSSARIMAALLARDHLAQALAASHPIPAASLSAVTALDERLKANAARIEDIVGRDTLVTWRETSQPPATAWWWYLDERVVRPSALWAVLAGFFIAVSLSMTAEIARRLFAVGPDFVGVFSVLVQTLLAWLAGRTLTAGGRQSLERTLAKVGIKRRYGYLVETGLALAVLLIVTSARLSLPSVARYYNNQGVLQQESGQVTSAIQNYQRAVSLTPGYAEAHYNLGSAYEDILVYDLALSSYQTAVRSDSRLYAAYNNLARVYMLHRKDYANALALLNTALDLDIALEEPAKTDVRYALLKNRGWANLGLMYLTLAETDLRQALALRPSGAAAHCLLAQVLEAQGDRQAAVSQWEDCVRYEKSDVVPVEASWVALARERLSGGETR